MANLPPENLNGIRRMGRGMVVVKPKDFKGTLRRLWQLTRGSRKGLPVILLLSALASVSAVVSPAVTGQAVSAIDTGNPLLFILLFMAALYVGDWLIKFLQQMLMAKIGQNIIKRIRSVLFNKMKTLPVAFYDKRQHGELMSRMTNDIDNISTTISSSLTLLLTYGFTILGVLFMMLRLSPLLTLVAMVGVVFIFILTRFVTKRTKKLFSKRQQCLGALNGHVEEGVSGMSLVKAFCREEEMEREFRRKNDEFCEASIRALIVSGFLMPMTNVINNLCYVGVAVFSGLMYVEGMISEIGLITSFLLYVRQFTRPFVEIANIYNNFQTAVAGAERVFEILDKETEPEDAADALSLSDPRGEITLEHVSFGYIPEKNVLNDISLRIPAGTRVAVVGATGSGKTTLIQLLNRFYDVTQGRILLDGHDIREYRMADLRRAYGVVLQDTALFTTTVRENLCYGRENLSDERLMEAARLVGADTVIEHLPQGLDTVLSQGGAELSQGERQLLTIARAVLTHAPIMILDEATSSVDTVTEQKIRRAMLKLCENRTSFVIAHRLSTIRDSDIILVIDGGVIAEQGTHEELMRLDGRYAAMYRTQTAGA